MIKNLLLSLGCFAALSSMAQAQTNATVLNKQSSATLSQSAINSALPNSSIRAIRNNTLAANNQVFTNNANSLRLSTNMPNTTIAASTSAALDVGISAIIDPQNSDIICQNPFSPTVTVKNFGTDVVTSVTIKTYINNSAIAAYSNIYTGTIAANGEGTVTLVPHTIPTEQLVSLRFEASLPNGQTDANAANNSMSVTSLINYNILNLPYTQNFENTSALGGIAIYNFDVDTFQWRITNSVSAYGSGTSSVYFDNYGFNSASGWQAPYDTEDWMVLPPLNLTNASNPSLTFDMAYKGFIDGSYMSSDTLLVVVSSDCYTNYSYIYNQTGDSLSCQTGTNAYSNSAFVPTSSEWCTRTLDLSQFIGQGRVSIIFINLANESNRLFIDNISIKNNCNLTASISNTRNITCFGINNGTATANTANGVSPYTYAWSNGQTLSTATALAAGTYTVTVTDANGCTATTSATITQPQAAISTQISNVVNAGCAPNSGQFQVVASGGTGTYTYFMDAIQQSTGLFTGLNAGTYTVTVTDANSCSVTQTATLQTTSTVTVAMQQTATTCAANDGTATAIAAGGTSPYTYTWSNAATTASIANLVPATYVVTVTDQSNCQVVGAVTVTNACTNCTFDVDLAVQNETCQGANNGSITVTAVTGTLPFTYAWGQGINSTSSIANNLAPNTYSVTITDATGCQVIRNATIAAGSNMSVNVTAQAGNSAAMAMVQGGMAPYTYLWSDGSATASVIANTTGSYTVTVTDANNCSIVSSTINLYAVSIDEIAALNKFEVFPNPNNGHFSVLVEMSTVQQFEIQIIDVLGRTIMQSQFNESLLHLPISLNALSNGMYFVVLKADNKVSTKKLFIGQ